MVEIITRISWEGERSISVDLSPCCRIKGSVLITRQRYREQKLVEKMVVSVEKPSEMQLDIKHQNMIR